MWSCGIGVKGETVIFSIDVRVSKGAVLGVGYMLTKIAPFLRPIERLSLTQGERSLLLAYFGVAFFGAALGINVILTLGGAAAWIVPFGIYDYWVILSCALGGIAALYLGRKWFGHAGIHGVRRALLGMIWVSVVGALIGGSFALPLYGTMFGPFTMVVTLLNTPILALLWASALFSAHLMMKIRREEYDSILYVTLPSSGNRSP